MAEEPKKCANPACTCMARQDSRYCGTWCESAAKTEEAICECGHAGCGMSV